MVLQVEYSWVFRKEFSNLRIFGLSLSLFTASFCPFMAKIILCFCKWRKL